jgi:hypothetical protein
MITNQKFKNQHIYYIVHMLVFKLLIYVDVFMFFPFIILKSSD